MVGAVFQADELQRGHHVITALLRVELGQQERKFDVLERGENRDQVERLENVADVRIAPVGRLFVIEPENVLPQNQQLACSRAIDGRDHVQQRGLPRAGRPHEREKFATGNLDGDIVQRFHLEGIAFEHLADISGLDDPGLSSDISCNSSAHDCPLILILFPSFKSCGPEVITSSPPFKPCTRRPPLRCEITRTCRIRAFPLKAMKTTFPCGPPSAWLANCDVTSSPLSAVRSRMVPVTGALIRVASSSDLAYASWPSAWIIAPFARAISSARGPILAS